MRVPWSAPRYLDAGFTFEMPAWALYSLLAIGLLFALFIAGWFVRSNLGRRRNSDDATVDGELGVDDVF